MKFEHFFTFSVILIILFSLGCVAAGDNTTSDDVCLASDSESVPNEDLTREIDENQDTLTEKPSSGGVDLSVWMDEESFFQSGSTVIWPVSVKVNNGTAYNTKVHVNFTGNMEYKSDYRTMGTYNPSTGIWDVGNLTSSDNAFLMISTKLKEKGRFKFTANATTTSKDVDLSNNFIFIKGNIEKYDDLDGAPGEDIPDAEITTSDDKKESKHREHYRSGGYERYGGYEDSPSKSKSVSKSSLSSLNDLADLESDVSVEGIQAYDYTKVPLLIFALFLIILIGLFGYDKFKTH